MQEQQYDDAHLQTEFRFDGSDYDPELDRDRLTGQLYRIFNLMHDGRYRTLEEIATITGDPASSVSAQLRNLRKDRFGAHTVDKRRRGDKTSGLWEYRLEVNQRWREIMDAAKK